MNRIPKDGRCIGSQVTGSGKISHQMNAHYTDIDRKSDCDAVTCKPPVSPTQQYEGSKCAYSDFGAEKSRVANLEQPRHQDISFIGNAAAYPNDCQNCIKQVQEK